VLNTPPYRVFVTCWGHHLDRMKLATSRSSGGRNLRQPEAETPFLRHSPVIRGVRQRTVRQGTCGVSMIPEQAGSLRLHEIA